MKGNEAGDEKLQHTVHLYRSISFFLAEGLNQKGGKAAFEVQLHVLRFFLNILFDFLFQGILLGITLGN